MARVVMHPDSFLKELNVTLGKKLSESADVVKNNAKSEAPVKTGALQESIRTAVDNNELEAQIGSDLDYSIHVCLGTRKTPANPFLRRALSKSKQAIQSIFAKK